jgi:hypothetical protein
MLFELDRSDTDVTFLPAPDGQRFLVSRIDSPASPVTLILNWRGLRR